MINIAFEGIDGSGKSTQLEVQHAYFREKYGDDNVGICYLNSLDHTLGRVVNELYRKPNGRFKQFLQNRVVRETLYALCSRLSLRNTEGSNKDMVFSDRSLLTPFAHHTGIIPEWYLTLIEPNFYPDIVVYLDIPPELGFERAMRRADKKTIETLDDLRRFHERYERVISQRPRVLRKTEILRVDGSKPLEIVTENVQGLLKSRLGRNRRS